MFLHIFTEFLNPHDEFPENISKINKDNFWSNKYYTFFISVAGKMTNSNIFNKNKQNKTIDQVHNEENILFH